MAQNIFTLRPQNAGQASDIATRSETAQRFRQLNFHDDTLVDMKILPARPQGKDGRGMGKGEKSVVEIRLLRLWEKNTTARLIRFSGCTNSRVAMDFDVLAGNLPSNTSHVDAHVNGEDMRRLIESQRADWNVEYGDESRSPLGKKLERLSELICFRVQFFGGAVDVVARRYRVMKVPVAAG